MDWYYAIGEERRGPVTEEEFQRLVRQGVITPQTLVWREGMANWQAHGAGAPPPLDAHPAAGGMVCAGCEGRFASEEVISLDGKFYCGACKPLAVQRLKEGVASSTEADGIRNKYLKHEASVKSVGLLYYLSGAVVTLLAMGALLGLERNAPRGATVAGAAFLLALGLGQLWVGTGLRRLRRWARLPTGILSGIGLLGFPLGTLINAYILYLVFSQKGQMVFSNEYHAVMAATPHIKYRTSIVVWILLALLLALIGFGIAIAFVFGRS